MTPHPKSPRLGFMNLIKSFRVAALALALVVPGLAEIKTVSITVYKVSSETTDNDAHAVNYLINKGWRVKAVTASSSDAKVTIIFESPTPVAQLDDTTSTDDLFRIRKLTPAEIAREKAKIKEGSKGTIPRPPPCSVGFSKRGTPL